MAKMKKPPSWTRGKPLSSFSQKLRTPRKKKTDGSMLSDKKFGRPPKSGSAKLRP